MSYCKCQNWANAGGDDNCPYQTAQYVQCWRDGHAQGKAELESED